MATLWSRPGSPSYSSPSPSPSPIRSYREAPLRLRVALKEAELKRKKSSIQAHFDLHELHKAQEQGAAAVGAVLDRLSSPPRSSMTALKQQVRSTPKRKTTPVVWHTPPEYPSPPPEAYVLAPEWPSPLKRKHDIESPEDVSMAETLYSPISRAKKMRRVHFDNNAEFLDNHVAPHVRYFNIDGLAGARTPSPYNRPEYKLIRQIQRISGGSSNATDVSPPGPHIPSSPLNPPSPMPTVIPADPTSPSPAPTVGRVIRTPSSRIARRVAQQSQPAILQNSKALVAAAAESAHNADAHALATNDWNTANTHALATSGNTVNPHAPATNDNTADAHAPATNGNTAITSNTVPVATSATNTTDRSSTLGNAPTRVLRSMTTRNNPSANAVPSVSSIINAASANRRPTFRGQAFGPPTRSTRRVSNSDSSTNNATSANASTVNRADGTSVSEIDSPAIDPSSFNHPALNDPTINSSTIDTPAIDTSAITTLDTSDSRTNASALNTSSNTNSAADTSAINTSAIDTPDEKASTIHNFAIDTSAIDTPGDGTSTIHNSAIDTPGNETSTNRNSGINTSVIDTPTADNDSSTIVATSDNISPSEYTELITKYAELLSPSASRNYIDESQQQKKSEALQHSNAAAKAAAAAARKKKAQKDLEQEEQRLRELRSKTVIHHLTPEWDAKVDKIQNIKNPQTAIPNTNLTRHDFGTLIPKTSSEGIGWLNDEIISQFLGKVTAKGLENTKRTKRADEAPKYHAFSSHLYTKWATAKARKPGQSPYMEISRWVSRAKINGKRLLETKQVYIPINEHSHWTLIEISGVDKKITYYDSLGGKGEVYKTFALEFVAGVLGEDFDSTQWAVQNGRSVRQKNGVDCGVFVCMNALALAKGLDPYEVVVADEMPAARREIAAVLLNGGFSGDLDF